MTIGSEIIKQRGASAWQELRRTFLPGRQRVESERRVLTVFDGNVPTSSKF